MQLVIILQIIFMPTFTAGENDSGAPKMKRKF